MGGTACLRPRSVDDTPVPVTVIGPTRLRIDSKTVHLKTPRPVSNTRSFGLNVFDAGGITGAICFVFRSPAIARRTSAVTPVFKRTTYSRFEIIRIPFSRSTAVLVFRLVRARCIFL